MYVIVFYCFYVVIDVCCYCTALVVYEINNFPQLLEISTDLKISDSISNVYRALLIATMMEACWF